MLSLIPIQYRALAALLLALSLLSGAVVLYFHFKPAPMPPGIHLPATQAPELKREETIPVQVAEPIQVKCHSYADVQMTMFRADVLALGGNIAEHEALIATVEAAIVPYVAPPMPNPRIAEIKTRLDQIDIESIRALRAKSVGKGKAADDTKLVDLDTEADTLRAELAVTASLL